MLKDILKISGVKSLSKLDQGSIFGGDEDTIDDGIDKCCRKIPSMGGNGLCNPDPECKGKKCGCK